MRLDEWMGARRTGMSGKVFPLSLEQLGAVDPQDSVWLSASAGTGKTQVLSARVLRLLLQPDVRPEQILCLTFTKAGAAEMAAASTRCWPAGCDASEDAGGDLEAIGADLRSGGTRPRPDPVRQRARLSGRGPAHRYDPRLRPVAAGRLPREAGLLPGIKRPMEDRDRELLAQQVLSDLLVRWEEERDDEAISAIEMLSLRMGPDAARRWLMRCAATHEAWFGPGSFQPPMQPLVRSIMGIGEGDTIADVIAWCDDTVFDRSALRRIADAYHQWATPSAGPFVDAISGWLALSPEERLAGCAGLRDRLFGKEGALKHIKHIEKVDPGISSVGDDLYESLGAILAAKARFDLVDLLCPALEAGRRFAIAWDDAKRREGLLDFDDLIRSAAKLLGEPGLGDWIRYKLDRQFDHILVDEAQDTNEAQWSIIAR
jgi:ATP-dependent helicase/nuclease subunit A